MIRGFDSRFTTTIPANTEYRYAGIKISEGARGGPYSQPIIQWQLCQDMELARLPFHFWRYGGDAQDGIDQANWFWSVYQRACLPIGEAELPPVLDIEDVFSPRGLTVVRNIMAFLGRTEELWGRRPMVYSAGWWFDPWVKPYAPASHELYTYHLWESDPPPNTPIGHWLESDSVIRQVRLDFAKAGFNAKIDENEADPTWYSANVEGPSVPPPPDDELAARVLALESRVAKLDAWVNSYQV